jgi:hypothetical protein
MEGAAGSVRERSAAHALSVAAVRIAALTIARRRESLNFQFIAAPPDEVAPGREKAPSYEIRCSGFESLEARQASSGREAVEAP